MSEPFAGHAARLCGVICRELGWRPEEFWSATPQEIATIFTDPNGGEAAGLDRKTLEKLMERDAHG